MSAVGDALRRARLATADEAGKPRTQAWVANQLGVTQTAVSYWEAGRRSPLLDKAETWAALLDRRIVVLPTIDQGGDLVERVARALFDEWHRTVQTPEQGPEWSWDAATWDVQGDYRNAARVVLETLLAVGVAP